MNHRLLLILRVWALGKRRSICSLLRYHEITHMIVPLYRQVPLPYSYEDALVAFELHIYTAHTRCC